MQKQLKLFLLFGVLLSAHDVWAKQSAWAVRMGPVHGNYSGPIKGDFYVPTGLDVEYSQFMANNKTFFFRATLALELPESKAFYTYAGTGMRFYYKGRAMAIHASEGDIQLSAQPTKNFYWGFDFGMSQAIVQSFGTVLQAVSTMVDSGLHTGMTFQINEKFGFDTLIGASFGFGFSSVGVTGVTVRGLAGVTYSF